MKVQGLEGDYCPTCASVLALRTQDPKKVIVMCGSVCHSVLQSSGDYERLHASPTPVKVPEAKTDKRSEERDPGETEQHLAEKAGLVPEPKGD